MTNPSNKGRKFPVIIDSPHDCSEAAFGFNVSANGNFRNGRFVSAKRMFPPSSGSKVKPLSSEESIKLIASQSRKRRHSDSSQGKHLHVEKQRHERQTNQPGLIPVMRHNRIPDVLTPRERVLKALRLFGMVFKELDKDKAARHGTSQTDLATRAILIRDGKQCNGEKRLGVVPGVEVGDVFTYKAQLSIIGLHFNMPGGIDVMIIQGMSVATSVLVSEDAGYIDRVVSDAVVYCGEGDFLKTKNQKSAEDQRMTGGNLSLANNLRNSYPVRVITGKKKNGQGQRGKHYVYAGLYTVERY